MQVAHTSRPWHSGTRRSEAWRHLNHVIPRGVSQGCHVHWLSWHLATSKLPKLQHRKFHRPVSFPVVFSLLYPGNPDINLHKTPIFATSIFFEQWCVHCSHISAVLSTLPCLGPKHFSFQANEVFVLPLGIITSNASGKRRLRQVSQLSVVHTDWWTLKLILTFFACKQKYAQARKRQVHTGNFFLPFPLIIL